MKTTIRTLWNSLLIVFLGALLAGQARGQIFVANSGSGTIGEYDNNNGGTVNASLVSGLNGPNAAAVSGANLFVANSGSGTIGVYNATTGATVNASLVSGLSSPSGVAYSGNYLFVANSGSGTIGKYNATTGAPVNASLVSGLSNPVGIAVPGNGYLFVVNKGSGTIGKYSSGTGAPVNASLVSGLSSPAGVAVPGTGYLFVANSGTGTIGEYNTTTGAPVNASLVSGLSGPNGIAVAGANLFVVNNTSGTIGEYNATTGATVKASLVSGLNGPTGIAVVATPPQFNLLKTLPLQSNAWRAGAVNEALNKIYTSGNPADNTNTNEGIELIDGATLATPGKDIGLGQHVSVDNKTNRYWAATVYGGNVVARDGTTDSVVATVNVSGNVGYCPIGTSYDFFKSRVWVGCQCGSGNDPVFAIDANTFKIIAGPIGSNGIMGNIIANGANGRLYIYDPTPTPLSERVNPTTFKVTQNAFGEVMAVNALTNTLYAVDHSANNLQIINGAPDPEVVLTTVPLSYTPGDVGINPGLNRLYLTNPAAKKIEVRDGSTGALITTFALSAFGVSPDSPMAVDSTRGRIYVIDYSTSPGTLLVIEDLINATKPLCILSH